LFWQFPNCYDAKSYKSFYISKKLSDEMEDIIIYYALVYITSYFGLFTTVFFFLTLIEYKQVFKDPEVDLKKKVPFVSIIVPAFNESKTIGRTIESLQQLNYPKNRMEILVVDDGSTDDTFEVSKKLALKDSRIKSFRKENGGKGSALNFGIKKMKGEFMISLDADSFVSKDALRRMIGYFRDSKVMAVTPSMAVYKPKGFLQNLQYVEYSLGIYLRKVFGLLNCIHVTPGPFSIYRKSFFDRYGGYDENNLTEDIEVALRIQKNGYKIENSINAPVYTVAPKNFKSLLKQRMRWYYGFTSNILKNRDLFNPKFGYMAVLLLPAAFISVALCICIFLYFVYKNIVFSIDRIKQLGVTGLGLFSAELKSFKFRYITETASNFLTNPFLLLAIVAIIFTLISIMIAQRRVQEKKSMFLPFIYFTFTYWFFYAFWWLAPFIYKAFGGKIGWGKRKH
jgi:cellulose synthase/poly-beta-1,6-N-acetylglucosamine synthase-like glycosyltransferase